MLSPPPIDRRALIDSHRLGFAKLTVVAIAVDGGEVVASVAYGRVTADCNAAARSAHLGGTSPESRPLLESV